MKILLDYEKENQYLHQGPVWINNLFAGYSTRAYHDKHLCISSQKQIFIPNDKIKLNCFYI